jgi:hypothetical protein
VTKRSAGKTNTRDPRGGWRTKQDRTNQFLRRKVKDLLLKRPDRV